MKQWANRMGAHIGMSVAISALSASAALAQVAITAEQQQLLGIEVGAVTAVTSQLSAPLAAEVMVKPASQYSISANIAGVVSRIDVSAGDTVSAGQVLAEIASPAFLNLQADLLQALADLDQAEAKFEGDQALLDAGAIPERRLKQSKVSLERARVAVTAMEQQLANAGMSADLIKTLRATGRAQATLALVAPVSGVINSAFSDRGARVEVGEPLFHVVSGEALQLMIQAPPSTCTTYRVGDPVMLPQGQTTSLSSVSCVVQTDTYSVLLKADVPAPTVQILPGQHLAVQVKSSLGEDSVVVRVPRTAMASNDGQYWVFKRAGSEFIPVAVNIVVEEVDTVLVSGDLLDGDTIALKGALSIKGAWINGEDAA